MITTFFLFFLLHDYTVTAPLGRFNQVSTFLSCFAYFFLKKKTSEILIFCSLLPYYLKLGNKEPPQTHNTKINK